MTFLKNTFILPINNCITLCTILFPFKGYCFLSYLFMFSFYLIHNYIDCYFVSCVQSPND